MTPDEIRALLAYASAIDPRIRRNDPYERQLQVTAWHTQLERTDPNDARAAIDAHYARPITEPPMPGNIRNWCITRANDRIERAAAKAITGPGLVPMPEEIREQLRAIRETWAAPIRMNTPDRRNTPPRPHNRTETDADRARAGRPTTICHRCATDTPPPAGWNPGNPESPPVHCQPCQADLDTAAAPGDAGARMVHDGR